MHVAWGQWASRLYCMSQKSWHNAIRFAATVYLGGLAAGVLTRHEEVVPWATWLQNLAVWSAACFLIPGKVTAKPSVKRAVFVLIPLIQAGCIGSLANKIVLWPVGALFLFWALEWLAWLFRMVRSSTLARELDVYPGLAIGILVWVWLGGWFTAELFLKLPLWLTVLPLLVSSVFATRIQLIYESADPDALDTMPSRRGRWWSVPGQDTREALALTMSLLILGFISGNYWDEVWQRPLCKLVGWERAQGTGMYPLALLLGTLPLLIGNHPVRTSGWLPYVFWCLVVTQLWLSGTPPETNTVPAWLLQSACCCGMVAAASRLLALCHPDTRFRWLSLASLALVGGISWGHWQNGSERGLAGYIWSVILALSALAVHLYWLREWLELTAAPLAWLVYRIRHAGPGRRLIPWRGPLIVIANHAAWLDPFWLGKVIPRRLTPMMTSDFYDLPGLYWLMRYVLRVIRVEEAHARQQVPELEEAIARLDAGECLVIFPEGRLRREEGRLLAHFQRGVWLILQNRPGTPVVPCWIEGNWGSYFSWKDGPPMRNKPFDWGRTITVVLGEPMTVPASLLTDHRDARRYLEQAVLNLRELLVSQQQPEAATSGQSTVSPHTQPPAAESPPAPQDGDTDNR